MNGVDVTADVYDSETGVINIPSVTGDLYVSAVNVADPAGIIRVPADSAAEGYIPCCKLPVTAGMTIRLEYYLTKTGGYLYDGRGCGLNYQNPVASDLKGDKTLTLDIPSDGTLVVSDYFKGAAANGELSTSTSDRLYGKYVRIIIQEV
jgi:hypothetical protein